MNEYTHQRHDRMQHVSLLSLPHPPTGEQPPVVGEAEGGHVVVQAVHRAEADQALGGGGIDGWVDMWVGGYVEGYCIVRRQMRL